MKGTSCSKKVDKLSMAPVIHRVWRERNNRQFQCKSVPASVLCSLIAEEVRTCKWSWRNLKPTDRNRPLARDWRPSPRIFGSL